MLYLEQQQSSERASDERKVKSGIIVFYQFHRAMREQQKREKIADPLQVAQSPESVLLERENRRKGMRRAEMKSHISCVCVCRVNEN
jgi:hypothetical protein